MYEIHSKPQLPPPPTSEDQVLEWARNLTVELQGFIDAIAPRKGMNFDGAVTNLRTVEGLVLSAS